MININGTPVKTPQVCTIGIEEISSGEVRNALGDALIDRVAVKRRLDMEWGALSNAECSAILSAVKSIFFRVEYPDPEDGVEKLIICHVTDRESPMLRYTNGVPYWEGLRMTLMER
jgi:hypothetical protein